MHDSFQHPFHDYINKVLDGIIQKLLQLDSLTLYFQYLLSIENIIKIFPHILSQDMKDILIGEKTKYNSKIKFKIMDILQE